MIERQVEEGEAHREQGEREERLERLFDEFLDAADAGRDIAAELLGRAGALRADLEAKIQLERELQALSRDVGTPQRSPGAPQFLGRFQIIDTLGKGGISRVYLAYDPKLGRRIALKVLDRESLLDKDQRAWILNEARSLARIRHRGVIEVYEVGESATHAFVAMELLPGPSLHAVLRELLRQRDGTNADGEKELGDEVRRMAARLSAPRARIEVLARLAEALAQCHDHGILHRDIKPHNVLFDAEGHPKLIDFGLAHVDGADEDSRLGLTEAMVGTAAYSAPEQVESDQTGADPRSDQFSFGTMAYECMTFENPFQRKKRRATLDAVEAADPPPLRSRAPELPPDLALVVHKALSREPAERYASMAALGVDLRAVLDHRPVSGEEPSLMHVGRLWLRRHRRGVTIAGCAMALGLVLATSSWLVVTRERQASIRTSLSAIHPEEFRHLADFESSFEPLLVLKQQAREWDTGWLQSRLWGDLCPDVERTVHAWVAMLGTSYARDYEQSRSIGRPFQELMYRRLFTKEEVLCKECEENHEYSRSGTVEYPQEELAGREYAFEQLVGRMGAKDPYSVFVGTSMEEYPVPGTYRLQAWRPGADSLEFESVFFVEAGWPPRVVVDLIAPRRELWNRTAVVEFGSVHLNGNQDFLVPEFRVLPRLVTLSEYQDFRKETGHGGMLLNDPSSPSDAPALVDLISAMAYAHWAGARLPFSKELIRAAEAGTLRLERDGVVGGEYVLDLHPGTPTTTHYFLRYDMLVPTPLPELPGVIRAELGMVVDDRNPPAIGDPRDLRRVAFRVVFSADHPETYREVSTSPFEAR